MIRPVNVADAAAIAAIYNPYIEQTAISFEEAPVSLNTMEARIRTISAEYPYIVWEENNEVLGYAYLNKWKERRAYRFAVEDSVYIKRGHERKGIGTALLSSLIHEAQRRSLHAMVAGITVPNEGSVGLHEKLGFRKIGQLDEIGFKLGNWLNVGYWELLV
ncbi:MAG: GNAT family N-acetyltransferase [Treponema sp.]|jgi:phosphinothricin acetyltransferase|nr:GNAT family N-acetyltransferase [Treponema sp.]